MDITAKDKLIWIESYVKALAISDKTENDGCGLAIEAIMIWDEHIEPWLKGEHRDASR